MHLFLKLLLRVSIVAMAAAILPGFLYASSRSDSHKFRDRWVLPESGVVVNAQNTTQIVQGTVLYFASVKVTAGSDAGQQPKTIAWSHPLQVGQMVSFKQDAKGNTTDVTHFGRSDEWLATANVILFAILFIVFFGLSLVLAPHRRRTALRYA